ncbi:MAG: hypothetical protein U5R31_04855 [Acidimicrobiia bacterium]|nr:hypothetical protein [Acidimicrobiia bacterium]
MTTTEHRDPADVAPRAEARSGDRGSVRGRVLRFVGPPLLVPVLGFSLFGSTGRDDDYISFFAADSLATSGEILNYNGDRIEQSSSLLHTVVLGVLGWLTPVAVPTLGLVVGVLAACATVVVAGALAERIVPGTRFLAGVLTALATPFLYWAFGGLETSLAALLLVAFVLAVSRHVTAAGPGRAGIAGVVATVACWVAVRPEAWLVASASIVLLLLVGRFLPDGDGRRTSSRRLFVVLGVVLAAAAVLVVFRLAYFDAAVPQPVSAKADVPGVDRLRDGYRYFVESFGTLGLGVVSFLAAIGCYRWGRRGDPTVLLTGTTVVASVAFIVAAGGDWMELGRFAAPVVPLLGVLAAIAVPTFDDRGVIVGLVVLALVGSLLVAVDRDATGVPIWTTPVWREAPPSEEELSWVERQNKIHRRDIATAEALTRVVVRISEETEEPVRVASGQAGLVAYHLMTAVGGRAEFIDVNNLATAWFEDCPEVAGEPGVMGATARIDPWGRGNEVCGQRPADVLYGLGEPPPWVVDYTLVFATTGLVLGPRLLGGDGIAADQWIVVRDDLVDRVEGLDPA